MLLPGKRTGQSLAATGVPGLVPSRLFLSCDTGAEVSVLSAIQAKRKRLDKTLTLQAVNGTFIATHGTRSLTLDLGLRCPFRRMFICADVKTPILGADFLCHFHLLVNMSHCRLVDALTCLTVQGISSKVSTSSPSILPRPPSMSLKPFYLIFLLSPNYSQ